MAEISAKKYIIGNAKSSLVRVGASTIATLIITPFIISKIGIDNYSYVSVTGFFVSFAGIIDLGLAKTLVFLLNDKGKSVKEKNQIITAQKLINISLCIFALLLGAICLIFRFDILGNSISSENPYYFIVISSSFLILCVTIYSQFQSAFLESQFLLQKVNYGSTIRIMALNVLYFINFLTVNNTELYIASAFVAALSGAVYYEVIIQRKIKYKYERPTKNIGIEVAKTAFGFLRVGAVSSIYSALPRIAILYLTPHVSYIGILDVINKITMSVINLFASILQPLFSLSRKSPEKIKSKLNKVLLVNLFMGICFVAGIVLFKDVITNYFFNDKTVDVSFVGILLILYSFASMLFLCSQPLSFYLMGIGRNIVVSRALLINVISFFLIYFIVNSFFEINILLTLAWINISVSILYFVNLYYNARLK